MKVPPEIQDYLSNSRGTTLDDLVAFLKIASVSTDPEAAPQVLEAAQWFGARLERAGLERVQVLPTGEHACVYGEWIHAEGQPTVLIYGHFDVQPADPLELWASPPFEPLIEDGRVFARGSADMKGNLLIPVLAVEAMLKCHGKLPLNVKFLAEGQEEVGSRDLPQFIAENKHLLACDLVITPDSPQWSDDQPALWTATRGLCALEVTLETASADLHSGLYGGNVPNAAHAMVELLATLHSPDGGVAVDGFYDDVLELDVEESSASEKVPFDEAAFKSGAGVDTLVGEPGYSIHVRTWARPTLEINGVWSGYQGEGVKTVIPCQAHAKVTCRLVNAQNPERVLELVTSHIQKHKPQGARLHFSYDPGKARPYKIPLGHPAMRIVSSALERSYGRTPYLLGSGGSLPVTELFLTHLGAHTVCLGFGQLDERFHAPNEFIRLRDIERGELVYADVLKSLSESKGN